MVTLYTRHRSWLPTLLSGVETFQFDQSKCSDAAQICLCRLFLGTKKDQERKNTKTAMVYRYRSMTKETCPEVSSGTEQHRQSRHNKNRNVNIRTGWSGRFYYCDDLLFERTEENVIWHWKSSTDKAKALKIEVYVIIIGRVEEGGFTIENDPSFDRTGEIWNFIWHWKNSTDKANTSKRVVN